MSDKVTIARPYANALFADAVDNKLLQPWQQVLRAFSIIVKDLRIQKLISSPSITDEQRVTVLLELAESAAAQAISTMGDRVKNFIVLLTEGKRLLLLPEISWLYQQLLNKQEGIVEAEMISAYPIGEDHRKSMRDALEARFSSKVSLKFSVDETLIGGAIVRAGNWVMDGSVKGKLEKLAGSIL